MLNLYETPAVSEEKHVWTQKYQNLHNLPHWHIEHEIIYLESGEADVIVDGVSYHLVSNQGCFIFGEQLHSVKNIENGIISVIKIDPRVTEGIIGCRMLDSPILQNDYRIAQIFSEIANEQKNGLAFSNVIIDSTVTVLVARIFRSEVTHESNSTEDKADTRYKTLLEIMERNLSYISFDDAAAHMHFSRSYFSDYFLRRSGMSFTRYLNILRVASAVQMIRKSDMPMTQIAGNCGFGTIRNFNRVFKELTGYSPTNLPNDFEFVRSFRTSSKEGIDPTLGGTQILSE